MIKLKAENISVEFFIQRTQVSFLAIQDVSFEIATGKFITIVGASGCGKSTLLNVIAGLLPISAGRILLDGHEITGTYRDCAMVFQSPALMPWRSVMGNTIYGLELQGLSRKLSHPRGQKIINLLGLHGFEDRFPHELSGGMQQRVNLARALATEPSLLLLDEPLSSLDALTREAMQLELQNIWQQTESTFVYVTHQIDEAIYLADRVMVMSKSPSCIKEIIDINFPRPRSPEIKHQPHFNHLEQHIWNLLHD